MHVDQHALAFVPGSSSILLAGNDGGVHGTTNANTATLEHVDPTWFNMDTGLNTIEFYSGDISGNFATAASPQANGGAQDNGSELGDFHRAARPARCSGRWASAATASTPASIRSARARSLRFWQGNNSGGSQPLHHATARPPAASWTSNRGGWTGDTQSFIFPFDLFHGGIAGGDDCAAGRRAAAAAAT